MTATARPDASAGPTALLVVAGGLLRSASRGDHPELVEALRALVSAVVA